MKFEWYEICKEFGIAFWISVVVIIMQGNCCKSQIKFYRNMGRLLLPARIMNGSWKMWHWAWTVEKEQDFNKQECINAAAESSKPRCGTKKWEAYWASGSRAVWLDTRPWAWPRGWAGLWAPASWGQGPSLGCDSVNSGVTSPARRGEECDTWKRSRLRAPRLRFRFWLSFQLNWMLWGSWLHLPWAYFLTCEMGIIKLGAPLNFAVNINRGIEMWADKSICKTKSTILQDKEELVYHL